MAAVMETRTVGDVVLKQRKESVGIFFFVPGVGSAGSRHVVPLGYGVLYTRLR